MSLQQVFTLLTTGTADAQLIASPQTNIAGAPLQFKTNQTGANTGKSSGYIVDGNVYRPVTVGSTANISTATFTVYGVDSTGLLVSDTITGINNNSVATTKLFRSVYSIINVNGVGPVFAGLGFTAVSYPAILDNNRINGQLATIQVEVSAGNTPVYTVYGTASKPIIVKPNNLGDVGTSAVTANTALSWFTVSGFAAQTTSVIKTEDVFYASLYINMAFASSAAGFIRMTILQPGLV